MSFIKTRNLREMTTGQFINLVSGSKLAVGEDLDSCTSSISYTNPFEVSGNTVRLVDTPGFDDAKISDYDVLKTVAHGLQNMYVGYLLSTY